MLRVLLPFLVVVVFLSCKKEAQETPICELCTLDFTLKQESVKANGLALGLNYAYVSKIGVDTVGFNISKYENRIKYIEIGAGPFVVGDTTWFDVPFYPNNPGNRTHLSFSEVHGDQINCMRYEGVNSTGFAFVEHFNGEYYVHIESEMVPLIMMTSCNVNGNLLDTFILEGDFIIAEN